MKKNKRNPAGTIFKIILALLVLAALAFFLVFRIRILNVEGNQRYTKEEIKTMLNYNSYKNSSLLFYFNNRQVDTTGMELIDGISVSLDKPWEVTIRVQEEQVAGCIQRGESYVYYDSQGVVTGIFTTQGSNMLLTEGISAENCAVGDQLPGAGTVFSAIAQVQQQLSFYNLTADSISVSPEGSLDLKMGDIIVKLGLGDLIPEKMSEVADLQESMAGLKGILHLENYDSTQDSIIFTKES